MPRKTELVLPDALARQAARFNEAAARCRGKPCYSTLTRLQLGRLQ